MSGIDVQTIPSDCQSSNIAQPQSLLDIIFLAWRQKLIISLITFGFMVAALGYLYFSKEMYTVSMAVLPIDEPDSSSSHLSIGSLPFLGGGTDDQHPNFALFKASLSSERLAATLEEKYHYSQSELKDRRVHSATSLAAFIAANLIIVNDQPGALTTLRMQFVDPEFGRKFMSALYNEATYSVRAINTERAQHLADYAEDRFKSETNRSLQEALVSLLLSQEQLLMLARANVAYAAMLVDGPTVTESPTSPRWALTLSLAFIAGFSIATFYVVLQDAFMQALKRRHL